MQAQQPSSRIIVAVNGLRRSATALALAASIVGVAWCAAGCGGSSPKTSTNGTAAGPKNGVDAAYKFSACMRNHGLTNFPDPKVTSSPGHQSVMLRITPAISSSPQFKSAQHACQSLLPAPNNASPAQEHAREQALLAFAKCLRAHGLSGFPDPTSQGQLTLAMVHAAGIDLQAPDVLPAAKACVGLTHGIITYADVERAVSGGGGGG
jgi:hypothetical protein